MTATSSAMPALFVIPGGAPRELDPVKARVAAPSQLTHAEAMQAAAAADPHRGLRLLPEANSSNRRRLHPGDILYWVACLGGVCLLLLCATT